MRKPTIPANLSLLQSSRKSDPRNLCEADLASGLTTSLHLLPNRRPAGRRSAVRGLWCNVFTNRAAERRCACHRAPGESHRHLFRSMAPTATFSPPGGIKSAAGRSGGGKKALHTHKHTRQSHNARKRPRLRPSYITWNPSVLLQCICTPHSTRTTTPLPFPSPLPRSTTLIPANVSWKV